MDTLITIATLLGGLSAIGYLVEKLRSRSAKKIKGSTSNPVDLNPNPTLPSNPKTISTQVTPTVVDVVQSASRSGGDVSHPLTVIPAVSNSEIALPIEAILEVLRDPDLTDLQKAHFAETNGRRVVWIGKTASIDRLYKDDRDSKILLLLTPRSWPEMFPPHIGIVFASTEAQSLLPIRIDDIIVVEGDLQFSNSFGELKPRLENAKYIRTVKSLNP